MGQVQKPIRIIQISDMHLLADVSGELLKVKTQDSLQAVLDLLKANLEHPIDLIILSGDISQDATAAAYTRVADMLKPFNVPVYCLPGNHDDPSVMEKVYPYANVSADKHIVLKDWHIILLNSQKPRAVEGLLDESQLSFLQQCLQKYPDHYAMVFFHHHPVPVGSRWLDKIGLTNALQFWEMVAPFTKLKAVVAGHVHQESAQSKQGIDVYTVPSTCIQFKRHHDEFSLDNIPPGYRYLNLYADGHIETAVKRTAKYIGVFDQDAKGY